MSAVIAICVGASLGALARWLLVLWLVPDGLISWGTLAANLIGGYWVGVGVVVVESLPQLDPVWRLALLTGFLGALTTFSSFSAEVVQLFGQARYFLALGTVALHVLGSLVLTYVGMKTAMLWFSKA
jgi:CrcB protein